MFSTILLLLLPLAYGIFRAFRPPLSNLPAAHPLCRYTSAWIIYQTLRDRRNAAIHRAHERHGPIVVLSPKEVSVASADGLKKIYSGGWPKDPWYNVFENYGKPTMFTLLPGSAHAARKRLLAHTYSHSSVSASAMLSSVSSTLLPLLLSQLSGETNAHGVFVALTMDIVTSFLFTPEGCSGLLRDAEKRRWWLRVYYSRHSYFPLASELPRAVALLKKLGISLIPRFVDVANNEIEAWCADLCQKRAAAFAAGKDERHGGGKDEEKAAAECVYDRLLAGGVPDLDAQSEALDQIGAGHETTTLALSFTVTALSARPDLQRQLRESLEGSTNTAATTTEDNQQWRLPHSYKKLEQNALLDAIIKESLRLYTPIPGTQRRLAPIGGGIVENTLLPGGINVGSQAWTLHRNASAFVDPEVFRPERWLQATDDERRIMEAHWWPFGSGGRGCIGRWLATYEMRMVLAAVYANFETSMVEKKEEEEEGAEEDAGISMTDRYTTSPIGEDAILVRFDRV